MECEDDHAPEVNNAWSYTSRPSHIFINQAVDEEEETAVK
jgi:hypothetical protein